MNREDKTQINEMAEVIEHTRRLAMDVVGAEASSKMIATDLYDKGYRKSSDVAEEIFGEIEEHITTIFPILGNDIVAHLAELKKKYTEGGDINVLTKDKEGGE